MKIFSNIVTYFTTQGFARALRHRDYAIFTGASWITIIGSWMQRVAVGWLTWDLTHSGLWLGLMAAASAVPSVALLPITGAITERVDRLKLLRVTQVIMFSLNALLAALTISGYITIEILLALTIVIGIGISFNQPARITIGPSLVPREDLPAAISVNSFVFTTGMFIGPAVAGFLIAHGGAGFALAANAASYLPFYVILYIIEMPERRSPREESSGLIADVVDGVRYVAKHPGIGPILASTVLLSILVRPLSDLAPGFIDDVFKEGPVQLGLLMSAYGVGGMIGSFWMGNRGRMQGITNIYIVQGLLMSLLTVAFASIDVIVPAIALMTILGITNSASNNAAQSLIQGSVAPTHRMRVISLFALNVRAAPAAGALLMGYLSHFFGLQIPVSASAILALTVMLFVIRRRRTIIEASEIPAMSENRAGRGGRPSA